MDYSQLKKQYDRMQAAKPATPSAEDSPSQASGVFGRIQENEKPRTIFGKAADAVDWAYEAYKEAPVVKQVREGVGQAVRGVGTAVGAAWGAALTPLERSVAQVRNMNDLGFVEGTKKTLRDTPSALYHNVVDTAKSTGQFGQQIGEEGAAQAPLAGAGKLVNAAQAYSQAYHGVENIEKGNYLEGGIQLGGAFVSGKQVIKGKGLLVDKDFVASMKGNKPDAASVEALKESEYTPEQKKLIDKHEQVYSEVLNLGKKQMKSQQQAALSGREARNIPRILAEEGVVIQKDANGKIDTTPAIELLRQRMDIVDTKMEEALAKNPESWFNPETAYKDFEVEIKKTPNKTASQKKAMIAEVRKIVDDEVEFAKEAYGEKLKAEGVPDAEIASQLETYTPQLDGAKTASLKKGLYSQVDYDATKTPEAKEAIKIFARKTKEAIEGHYSDANIKGLNNVLGTYSEAIKALKSVHGQVVRGSLLGKRLNQLAGAAIGTAGGGPAAGMAGYEVAGRLTDAYLNPTRRTGDTAEAMLKAGIRPLHERLGPLPEEGFRSEASGSTPDMPTPPSDMPSSPVEMPSNETGANAKMIQNMETAKKLIGPTKNYALAPLAGLEPQFDDKGKFTGFKFNPERAMMGALAVLGMGSIKNVGGRLLPAERQMLMDYTDYVASGAHTNPKTRNFDLEANVTDILLKHDISQMKTQSATAGKVGDVLDMDANTEYYPYSELEKKQNPFEGFGGK